MEESGILSQFSPKYNHEDTLHPSTWVMYNDSSASFLVVTKTFQEKVVWKPITTCIMVPNHTGVHTKVAANNFLNVPTSKSTYEFIQMRNHSDAPSAQNVLPQRGTWWIMREGTINRSIYFMNYLFKCRPFKCIYCSQSFYRKNIASKH